jgi:hypothetical protein
VKHTLAWSKSSVPELAAALKGGAEPVPPAYHISGEPELQTFSRETHPVAALVGVWPNQPGEN